MSDRTIVSFDYAIKYMLRDKANFDVLNGFLSELLSREVTILDLLESESNKDDDAAKVNRVDLKAKIDDGEIAIFEIQCYRQADFFGKVLYGVSKAVTEQISSGGRFNVKKVYSISIAYYDLGAKSDYIFLAKMAGFRGLHTEELIQFAQPSQPTGAAVDIHPEYYLILPKMFNEKIQNKFDEWVYTLKTSTVKSEFTASGLKEAAIKLDKLKMTKEERDAYEKFLEDKANEESIVDTAKKDGERNNAIKMAKKMKAKGKGENEIAEFTELTIEEIREL